MEPPLGGSASRSRCPPDSGGQSLLVLPRKTFKLSCPHGHMARVPLKSHYFRQTFVPLLQSNLDCKFSLGFANFEWRQGRGEDRKAGCNGVAAHRVSGGSRNNSMRFLFDIARGAIRSNSRKSGEPCSRYGRLYPSDSGLLPILQVPSRRTIDCRTKAG